MSGPSHRLSSSGAVFGLFMAALLAAGCGGGSAHVTDTGGTTTSSTTAQPPPITHANPVTLLPTGRELSSLIKPAATPTRYDETLSPSTLSSAFASRVPRAARLASGTAELDVVGRRGSFIYAHVFVFKKLAGAEALTATFLSSTRLRTSSGQPSGAPGQRGQASSQSYGRRQVSYRYAFRDHNVLAYVELDGPRSRYSLAQVAQLASIIDRHIRSALG